jgi:hypothetical protein
MRVLHSKRLIALVVVVLVAGAAAGVGITAVVKRTVLASGENLHYEFVRTVADGFDSGWHTHPGLVVVQVQEGSFQFTQGSCTPKTVSAGETFIEVPYLPVRAVATGRIVWTTTLLTRYEEPTLTPVASPCP